MSSKSKFPSDVSLSVRTSMWTTFEHECGSVNVLVQESPLSPEPDFNCNRPELSMKAAIFGIGSRIEAYVALLPGRVSFLNRIEQGGQVNEDCGGSAYEAITF